MSGIYIHIPFCRQACTYCDFHFTVRHDDKSQLTNAICMELIDRKGYLATDPQVNTVYFGGGTPSLLDHDELNAIMDTLRSNYSISDEAEITLEANPDDLTHAKLGSLKESGINRLSIGVQSFNDHELKFMNRAHDAENAISCIQQATDTGFTNISIDLIYGVPGQSMEAWEQNLWKASQLPVSHLSCYALTVEHHTLLHNQVKSGRVSLPDDDLVAEQFLLMNEYLSSVGFDHYEVSNFARTGSRSRHNSSYWNNVIYLGAGPSANSFDKVSRSSNIRSNKDYIKKVSEGTSYSTTERLSEKDIFNEYIMTRLRTREGVDKEQLSALQPAGYSEHVNRKLNLKVASGHLSETEGSFYIPYHKWLLSDAVIRELFI